MGFVFLSAEILIYGVHRDLSIDDGISVVVGTV